MEWGSALCPVRVAGDLSLLVSFPILISRILASGDAGISMMTQGLHLIVFLTRYMDLMVYSSNTPVITDSTTWTNAILAWYNPALKGFYIGASGAALASLAYVRSRTQSSPKSLGEWRTSIMAALKNYAVYMIPMAFLAYRFHYNSPIVLTNIFPNPWHQNSGALTSLPSQTTEVGGLEHSFGWILSLLEFFSPSDLFKMETGELMEVAWSFSIYLSAIADIPQYVRYYHFLTGKTKVDWWLMSYMLTNVGFRLFYLPHWVIRFTHEGFLDPITFSCGVVQVFVFWMFFVLCFNKVNNEASGHPRDEEAQWEDYEAGWDAGETRERYAGEWDGLILYAEERPLRDEKTPVSPSHSPLLPTITVTPS